MKNTKTEPFFFYAVDPASGRKVTMAGCIVKTQKGNSKLAVGIAECSKRDQFCKRTGKEKAIGRANSSTPFAKIKINAMDDTKSIAHKLIDLAINTLKYKPLKPRKDGIS